MLLANRVAIVTGASGGLGKAIATALSAQGAAVVVNYVRNAQSAQALVESIQEQGGNALAVQADIATTEGAEALVKAAISAFGKVDILVNNAGINRDTLLMRMKEEDWDAVLDTNLKGAFLCTKAVSRPMMKARFGRIINIRVGQRSPRHRRSGELRCRQGGADRPHPVERPGTGQPQHHGQLRGARWD